MIEYTNEQIAAVIDSYIHSERDRKLLKRKLIDGISNDRLAQEFGLSVRWIQTLIYRGENVVFKHL